MTKKNNYFSVDEKVVVITGASGQMGSEYSRVFLEEGARVVALDINESQSLIELQSLYSDFFTFIKTDITNKNQLSEALDFISSNIGSPEVLVNNAAIDSNPSSPPEENGLFEEYPESLWDKVIDVNLKGVFLTCQIFGGNMAKNNGGSIINISSIYGLVSPDQSLYDYRRKNKEVFFKPAPYSASKSALLNLTRYLGVYWAKKHIRVNSLTLAGVFNNQDKEFLDAYCSRIPIGRMASQNDYNGALIFLASDSSRYMTGSNLIIDGGWTAI